MLCYRMAYKKNHRECIEGDEKEKNTQTMNRLSKASKMNRNEFWKQSKRILNKGQNELYDTITEDGIKLKNTEEAKKHIREYFRNLYQARPGKPEYEHWTEHIQQIVKETDKTMEKLPDPNPITTKVINQTTKTWKKQGPGQHTKRGHDRSRPQCNKNIQNRTKQHTQRKNPPPHTHTHTHTHTPTPTQTHTRSVPTNPQGKHTKNNRK